MLNCTVLFLTVLIARTALAEKGMTAEQYDKLTEMQRIKPKDDEEAKVRLVLSCFVLFYFVLSCLVLFCVVLSCLVLSCLVLSCLVFYFSLFRLSNSITIFHFLLFAINLLLSLLHLFISILPTLFLIYFLISPLLLSLLFLSLASFSSSFFPLLFR